MFRPAAERFHSKLDWLDSWHSFSFAGHHDPAWMGFGPLRVINDDTIAAGRGFGMHPHRDMEIVTVMVDGELEHRDSMGHTEVLRAGEVQCMSAGTGVVHSEVNRGEQDCRLLQIWVEPSQAGLAQERMAGSCPLVVAPQNSDLQLRRIPPSQVAGKNAGGCLSPSDAIYGPDGCPLKLCGANAGVIPLPAP